MGNILAIVSIGDNRTKAKEITCRVIKRGIEENRAFGDILQEEVDKLKRGENDDTSKRVFKLSRGTRN